MSHSTQGGFNAPPVSDATIIPKSLFLPLASSFAAPSTVRVPFDPSVAFAVGHFTWASKLICFPSILRRAVDFSVALGLLSDDCGVGQVTCCIAFTCCDSPICAILPVVLS
jgi:hypothetical protein